MNKSEVKEIIKNAIDNRLLAHMQRRCCFNYENNIPILASDKLLMVINEDDFIFNGYDIIRFKDIKKVKVKDDMYLEILEKEGLMAKIEIPPVKLNDWKTVFEDLKLIGKNIIVEKESLDGDSEFVIGQIEKIYKNFAYVYYFDPDGIWDDEPTRIPYSEITKITFGSRYVDVFSKHIKVPKFDNQNLVKEQ